MCNTRGIDTNVGKVRWFVSDKLRQRFLLPFDLALLNTACSNQSAGICYLSLDMRSTGIPHSLSKPTLI